MKRRTFLGGLAAAAWAAPETPAIRADRLRTHLEELSVFGRPSGGSFADGVSRVAYSDADVAGRAYVRKLMEAAGLKTRIDAAGNIYGRRAGMQDSLPPVLFGSHIDSVPNGGNFDGDLTNIINGQFDYSRLTDTTQELPATSQATGNGVTNPNGLCEATQPIATGGITTSSATVTLTGAVPSTIQPGWSVYVPVGYSIKLPTATTVLSVSGSTITLSATPVSSTGSTAPPTLYFPGHPPVVAVHDPNS